MLVKKIWFHRFGFIIESSFWFREKNEYTISSIHCRCATRILFRLLGELESKDQVIPQNVALGRRAKQRGLTHAHHRRGLEVEPKAAGQFLQGLYGQGKSGENISFSRWSGKVRESQGKSGNSTKKSGKSWKNQGDFFGKFLPPMNQDPLFFKIHLRQVTCEILISAAKLMFLCMYALGVHSSFCCWLILCCSFII